MACLAVAFACAPAAAQNKPNQIKFEYAKPKNPAHQPILEDLKRRRALELVQELLAPLRLPEPLLFKVEGCDGDANAWYEDRTVTVCYELIEEFQRNAPRRDLAIGLSRQDTVIGPTVDTFLHESGHAIFDILEIPVLGREEDAADQFSAFIMLRLDKERARRLILGTAYGYRSMQPGRQFVIMRRNTLADEHSTPGQRMFNVLCMAYGADKALFADVVEKKFLPKNRAELCAMEYRDIAFAFIKLVGPHIDREAAKGFHEVWAFPANARRGGLSR
jgi:hypothetical protein